MGAGLLASSPRLHAADHLDAPGVMTNAAADITDVYAWMSSDKSKLNLVLDVSPLAATTSKFSNQVQYVFHLGAGPSFGMPPAQLTNIICTFATDQTASCWVGTSEYVHGDASATTGITSADGKVKVFAGLRDDPFFFNLNGFKDAVATVDAAEGSLMFDMAGCPQLNAATAGAVAGMLNHTMMGTAPPADFFAGKNVLSIVVQVDASLVSSSTNKIVGVWGSTNMAM
jgi:hypothetical protein